MKDEDLITRVKEHGVDEESVAKMLLELLSSGDINAEQVERVLGEGSKEWPCGWPYKPDKDGAVCEYPTFSVSVLMEFKQKQGNKSAYAY